MILDVTRRRRLRGLAPLLVLDRALEHLSDRLDAAVGMPREAREVVLGPRRTKIIEEEKRVELGDMGPAERALEMHTGAFERRLALQDLPDSSDNGQR